MLAVALDGAPAGAGNGVGIVVVGIGGTVPVGGAVPVGAIVVGDEPGTVEAGAAEPGPVATGASAVDGVDAIEGTPAPPGAGSATAGSTVVGVGDAEVTTVAVVAGAVEGVPVVGVGAAELSVIDALALTRTGAVFGTLGDRRGVVTTDGFLGTATVFEDFNTPAAGDGDGTTHA